MIKITRVLIALLTMAGMAYVWNGPAEAATITGLELTSGSVDAEGRFSQKLARLFEQPGLLLMNEYQPAPDIVSPITQQHRTFSLFTSGINNAPPPTATIAGSSITVDLSSLLFGVSRGDGFRAWNIGGIVTGEFNPETLEFCLTWDHLFRDRPGSERATFSLHGNVQFAAVPLPASVGLFLSGLVCLGATVWRRRTRLQTALA